MDGNSGPESFDLSIGDLMEEYSTRPSVAQWIWCIEFVAKFKKDIRNILAIMDTNRRGPDDLGKRTNEAVALRILEYLFETSKKDANVVCVPSPSESRVEFDFSLSTMDALQAIVKEIPLSNLRPGIAELSKFNILPFIEHKNSCLPKCALERLVDADLNENQTNASPSQEESEPVLRDEQLRHINEQQMHMDDQQMDTEEQSMPVGEQPEHMDEQQVHVNEQDEVIVIDDDDDDNRDNDGGEQEAVIEPVNNDNTNESPPSSSFTRQDGVCVKCGEVGELLICSNSDCSARVHKECLNCPVWLDEEGNFHCPQCWYYRVTLQYLESKKSAQAARKKLVLFLQQLSTGNDRFRDYEHPANEIDPFADRACLLNSKLNQR